MKSNSPGIRHDIAHALRGLLMGGADIIPGVSGGTMALILGIYERLVTAVSRFDAQLLVHIKKRSWSAAAAHVDIRFLAALGIGILTGIVVLGSLMHKLLDTGANVATTCPLTIAAFFGLIVASAWHVAKMIKSWNFATTMLIIAGILIAYTITGMPQKAITPGLPFLFLCGMIAICAMILPGISGAFIMLLLGVYGTITGAISGLKSDALGFAFTDATWGYVLTLGVFASGCAVGILSFSKVLHWLLDNFHGATMAVLCGFMIGSLRQLWPFQAENVKFPALVYTGTNAPLSEWLPQGLRNSLPEVWVPDNLLIPSEFSGLVLGCFGMMIAAAAFVLLLEWVSTRGAK